MTNYRESPLGWLVSETLVMSVIDLNALVLFLDGFSSVSKATS